jgi:hypothetical protein
VVATTPLAYLRHRSMSLRRRSQRERKRKNNSKQHVKASIKDYEQIEKEHIYARWS